jgi:hypothetical protein
MKPAKKTLWGLAASRQYFYHSFLLFSEVAVFECHSGWTQGLHVKPYTPSHHTTTTSVTFGVILRMILKA